jgi:predicted Zn-dependent protease
MRSVPARRRLLVLLGVAVACLALLAVRAWPQRYLHTARAALERRDYEAARASLERYLAARPDSPEAHLLLAQVDRRSNRYGDAARHLEACRRCGGPADAIELERGLMAIQNGTLNRQLEALCADHLARADADQYLILEALSQGLIKAYRLTDALVCLERMLVLQPDSNYALRRRAWIYTQIDEFDRAEADYRRALKIDPEDTVARRGLAQILLDRRQDGRQAAEHFERLWAVQHESDVAVGLARSWRLLGRGDEARRLLDDWLRGHGGDALALAERGRLALDAQATTEAEQFLRRALALAPYLADAHYTLCQCLIRQGRTAEAEQAQARMRQAQQESKAVKEQLGILTRRLQVTPGDPDLRCQVARLFLRYGEEEGVRWLLLNVQDHPGHRPSHLALAEYYEAQGDTAHAAEHRRLAGGVH